jgi:uncharacterized metal-binding protein YceD (DUF177 family)
MSVALPSKHAYRVSDLPNNSIKKFNLRPEPAQNDAIATELDLLGLRKLRFTGQIKSSGKSDWRLTGTIGATLIQPCTITLEPVTTRVDEPVERLFVKEMADLGEEEIEMPEDDTIEPLGAWIDPEAIMIESLCLSLPEYPRAEGATLGESVYTQPGEAPMRDEDARPFAALAALKDQLKSDDE